MDRERVRMVYEMAMLTVAVAVIVLCIVGAVDYSHRDACDVLVCAVAK